MWREQSFLEVFTSWTHKNTENILYFLCIKLFIGTNSATATVLRTMCRANPLFWGEGNMRGGGAFCQRFHQTCTQGGAVRRGRVCDSLVNNSETVTTVCCPWRGEWWVVCTVGPGHLRAGGSRYTCQHEMSWDFSVTNRERAACRAREGGHLCKTLNHVRWCYVLFRGM